MNETVKAVISAIVVLAVNIAALFGVTLDQSTLTEALCGLALFIATVWAIWKNHNFTSAAQQGQAVTNELKKADKLTDEATEAIKAASEEAALLQEMPSDEATDVEDTPSQSEQTAASAEVSVDE